MKGNATLRKLGPDDAQQLRELAVLTYPDTYQTILTPDEIASRLAGNYRIEDILQQVAQTTSNLFFGSFNGKQLVGYLHLSLLAKPASVPIDRFLKVSRIYVHPQYKGRGLGRMLMSHAEELCVEHRYQGLWLHCFDQNIEAIKFYERMGFQFAGKDPFEIIPGIKRFDSILIKRISK
jgi:diamine N-acetyltransferase